MQLRAAGHIVSCDKGVVAPGLMLVPSPRQGLVVASHLPPASLGAASSGEGVGVSLQHPLGFHPPHLQNPFVCPLVLYTVHIPRLLPGRASLFSTRLPHVSVRKSEEDQVLQKTENGNEESSRGLRWN